MKLASFQIQIGAVIGLPVTEKQITFHNLLSEIILGNKYNLAASLSIPVSYFEVWNNPIVLKTQIIKNLNNIKNTTHPVGDPINLVIFDLCSSPHFPLRDSLLLEILNGIIESIEAGICSDFTILLPKMTGEKGVFRFSLNNLKTRFPKNNYTVRLISNDGDLISYKFPYLYSEDTIPNYPEIREAAHDDVHSRIEKKCVKRLGHFTRNNRFDGNHSCRHFSYFLYNCNSEMAFLFRNWWETISCTAKVILYDLKNNDQMREVVLAHAEKLHLKAERIVDVINDTSLALEIKKLCPVVLVLDAIESGTTLQRYIHELEELNINSLENVFVTVDKYMGNLSESKLKFQGLIKRPNEPPEKHCEQCRLELPKTNESVEPHMRIRTYDMHYMINKAGWESEPLVEVPGSHSLQFKNIPNFSKMLEHFGDWIGFKFFSTILSQGVDDAWFVIHPAEGDSSILAQKLFDFSGNQLSIISVPREKIKVSQENGNSWQNVLGDSTNEPWVTQLNSMRGKKGNAVILDIFNGSDNTCKALIKLVRDYNLQPFVYCCLIDFNPDKEKQAIDEVKKIALYEWYRPRTQEMVV